MKKLTFKQKLYNAWNNEKHKKVRDIILIVSLAFNLLIFILFFLVGCGVLGDDKTNKNNVSSKLYDHNTYSLVHQPKKVVYNHLPSTIPQKYTLDWTFNYDDWSDYIPYSFNGHVYESGLSTYNLHFMLRDNSNNNYVFVVLKDYDINLSINEADNRLLNSSSFFLTSDYYSFNYSYDGYDWNEKTYFYNGSTWQRTDFTLLYIDFDTTIPSINYLALFMYNIEPFDYLIFERSFLVSQLQGYNLFNVDNNYVFDLKDYGSFNIDGTYNGKTELLGANSFGSTAFYSSDNITKTNLGQFNLSYHLRDTTPSNVIHYYNSINGYIGTDGYLRSLYSDAVSGTDTHHWGYIDGFHGTINLNNSYSSYTFSNPITYSGTFITYDNPNESVNGTFNNTYQFNTYNGVIEIDCSFMRSYPDSPIQKYVNGQPTINTYTHFNILKYGGLYNNHTSTGGSSGGNINVNNGLSDVFSLLASGFVGLGGLFSIQLLPSITIGALLFVPLVVSVIIVVVKLVRK